MDDFQVPKSFLPTVQHVLALDTENVLQMEGPVGSENKWSSFPE